MHPGARAQLDPALALFAALTALNLLALHLSSADADAGVAWKKREAGQAGRGLAQSSEESLDCDCLRVTWGWEEEDVQ